jgi:hypothetical protein
MRLVLVRMSRYFLTMGMERLSVEEAKSFWFANELVAYAFWGDADYEVIALPKLEVERGLKYLRKLKGCKTYGEAQKLYVEFSNDPCAPKLIPRIEDLSQHYEFLYEHWLAKDTRLPHDQDPENYADENPSIDYLLEDIENDEFIWNEAIPYLDDNANFAACRNIQIWTDAWIPSEISQAAGTPDLGYGVDYYEAELLYKNKAIFIQEFKKYGIEVIFENSDLRELAGY